MSQAAVLTTCQIPCRSGCPSRVFGGVYVPEVCAATGVEASVNTTKAAIDPTNQRVTGASSFGVNEGRQCSLAKHVQQARDRVVEPVDDPLFQRNDGVIGDVDVL